MKKILASLALFSFFAVTACNNASDFQSIEQLDSQYSSLSKSSNLKADADWYSALSPDLQSYYAEAKGKTGADLFDALHKIISRNNKVISYQDSKSFMYSTIDNIEQNGKTGIIDAYSGVFVPGSGGNGDTYREIGDANKDGMSGDFINCEHTWPQSFFNKQLPMVGDLHHLQSTLSHPNNRRSNFPFGMATGNVIYTTSGGSKLSVMDTLKKNNMSKITQLALNHADDANPSLGAGVETVFEPMDAQKGNTARCMLYFSLRYYDQNIRQGGYDKKDFWTSKVPMFITWDEKTDPVNDTDRKRNDAIFKKQGNRNPFIDIPNLPDLIGENVLETK